MTPEPRYTGDPPYLKQISRIKHQILREYLAPWARILGSRHPRLRYIDCFAGGDAYADEHGQLLPGSPLIALRVAESFVSDHPGCSLSLGFVERDHETSERLRALLASEQSLPASVSYMVIEESAQDFVEQLVGASTHPGVATQPVPTFLLVDPYGHPITIPIMRQLLSAGRTELLVNVMWFRINMDLGNPSARERLDRLFGHTQWRTQSFMGLARWQREDSFLDYFIQQVGARYSLRLSVPFSPEDPVRGKERRRKYYLVHFSSHPRAALLMKAVMWHAANEVEELQLGRGAEAKQLKLIDKEPDLEQLSTDLLRRFRGRRLTFDEVQVETLEWRFIDKHYRGVLKKLEAAGAIRVNRVESKRGLKGRDMVASR